MHIQFISFLIDNLWKRIPGQIATQLKVCIQYEPLVERGLKLMLLWWHQSLLAILIAEIEVDLIIFVKVWFSNTVF